ncbi:MAG: HD-GYP domain-containing protein [Rubrobacter sp.]
MEISDVAMLSALVILGPIWALLVAVPVVLYRDPLRTTFVASCDAITILAAGYVFSLFSEPSLAASSINGSLVYGLVAAGVVFYFLDALINSTFVRVKYDVPLRTTVSESFIPVLPSDILAVLAALGTAYVLVAFGPAAALVLFLGGAGALISLNLIHTRQKENEALKRENADLLSANVGFALALVGAVGVKEPQMVRLANASAVYARDIGVEFGFKREHLDRISISALLQDIGFAAVPDAVLKVAPSRLNRAGRLELERHTVVGEEVLASVPGFEKAAKWVRWHHERLDGTGYPDRLQAQWIPLEVRILGVASAYAALVLDTKDSLAASPRDARFALTSEANGDSGGLDPEVVKAFLRILDREDAGYGTAAGNRFSETPAVFSEGEIPRLRVVGDF